MQKRIILESQQLWLTLSRLVLMAVTKDELCQMLLEMKTDINENTSSLINNVKMDINSNIQQAVANLQRDLEAKMSNVFADIKSDVQSVKTRCDILESKVERLERISHLSDLLLNGVPYVQCENLLEIYNAICNVIKFDSADYTLQAIFRIGKSSSSKNASIVMKFISSAARNRFYSLYLKFKNLSLHHIGFNGNVRVFIQESLSKNNADIFRRAMEFKRSKRLARSYTHNGLVFVQVEDSSDTICCTSVPQLCELTNQAKPNTDNQDGEHKRKPSSEPVVEYRRDDSTKHFKHGSNTAENQTTYTPNHSRQMTPTILRSSSTSKIDKFFSKVTTGSASAGGLNIA